MGLVLKLRLKRPYGAGYNVGGVGLAEGGLREKKSGPVVKPGHRGWAMELVTGGTGGVPLTVRPGGVNEPAG